MRCTDKLGYMGGVSSNCTGSGKRLALLHCSVLSSLKNTLIGSWCMGLAVMSQCLSYIIADFHNVFILISMLDISLAFVGGTHNG